jgi:ABC-2 type transport system permease protein
LFRIIGSVVAILAMIFFQMYIQRAAMSGDPEKIRNILFSENGLITITANRFPPSAWISYGLIQYERFSGVLYMLLFAAASLITFLLFEYVGERFFLGGYLGSEEVSAKRKGMDEAELVKEVAVRSKVTAIFWREFNILNRVPVFFFNNVFPVVLVPCIFIIMFLTGGNSLMQQLQPLMRNEKGISSVTLIITGIGIFTAVANMTPPTSLSREGAQFFISKYIPVSPKEQILGKILHSVLLIAAGDILAVATVGLMLRLPMLNLIICIIVSLVASMPTIEIGLLIDLYRPLLVWDNPQKAVKQNMNGVINMFFNALWIGGVMFAVGNFIPNTLIANIVLIILFATITIVLYGALIKYAEKRYAEIEP